MKKILSFTLMSLALIFLNSANADVVGVVDTGKIQDNYTKVQRAADEISDKYAEIQRYALDKERDYKKLSTPLERKNFEDAAEREISKRQDAYLKLKEKKELEIETAIKAAIKQVAIENKIDTVVEKSVVFFGGVDITDKVVKYLNAAK